MPNMREALTYTMQNGHRPAWAIIPLRGKYPAIKGGHGCLDASADPEKVREWWTEYPSANIGIRTGRENGIVVLDIDKGHEDGVDGNDSLQDLERTLGELPHTVEALTPNGGRHLYFKYPEGYDIGCKSSAAEGIDIRGNSGYVAAPPSIITCTDRKARSYQWEISSYPNETPLAELPAAWLTWINEQCGRGTRFILPPAGSVTKGTRNETLFKYACQLRADDRDVISALREYNSQLPDPLTEKELETIAGSAMRYTPNTTAEEKQRASRQRITPMILAESMQEKGYAIRYNLITASYEISGRTPAGRVMNLDDLTVLMHDALADIYKGVTFDVLARYAAYEARENSYNPVVDLLEETEWDGTDRMPQLYALMGITDDSLSKALVKKWLMQSIALILNDDEKPYGADGCLTLNGPQGTGKTSLFRHLALRDEWFGEGCCIVDSDKDTTRRVVTRWISELGEVECTMKSDISKLKAFISNPSDNYRLPYAERDVSAPRRTSLCATCNSDRYLIDTTGNRRWWSVPITKKIRRAELLKLDALQMWSQVYTAIRPLTPAERAACYRLTDEEAEALAIRNGDYQKSIKAEDEVRDILGRAERDALPCTFMTVSDFKNEWPALRSYSASQIGQALKVCGVEVKHQKSGRFASLPQNPGR